MTPVISWADTLRLIVTKTEQMQTLDVPLTIHGIIVDLEYGDELGPEKNRHPKFTLLRKQDFDLLWSRVYTLQRLAKITPAELKEIRKSVRYRNPGQSLPRLDSVITDDQERRVVSDWKRRVAYYNRRLGKKIWINYRAAEQEVTLVGVVPNREFLTIHLRVKFEDDEIIEIQEGELRDPAE